MTTQVPELDASDTPDTQSTARKGHIGLIVFGSIFAGLLTALILALGVFGGATESVITGVVLLVSD